MTKRIKGFDGLRCYSILLVVITHLGIAGNLQEGTYLKENVFYFFSGPAGVNVFFAISGFLITTLILNEVNETGKFNLKFFFIRRLLRLIPPIIPFYIALFIFMQLGYVRNTTFGLLASIFYVFNFVPKTKLFWSSELSHTWSLAVEEQFYIIWAFIIKFFNSNQRVIIIYFLLILCVVAFYCFPFITIKIEGQTYALDEVFFTNRWTIPSIGPILIGALFAILNFSNWNGIREYFKGLKAGLFSLLVFFSPFYIPDMLLPVISLFHGLGAVLILLWIANNQNSSVINILEWQPIRYIGTISYGIYIWQGFFLRTGPDFTPKIGVHEYPQNIIFTFIVAILSYEIYEKRILEFKKRYKPLTK